MVTNKLLKQKFYIKQNKGRRTRKFTLLVYFVLFSVTVGILSIFDFGYFLDSRGAVTVTSVASGNWGDGTTWSTGLVPGSADDVTIQDGYTVTLNGDYTCASLTITAPTSNGASQLTIADGYTLTSTGNVTLNGGSNNSRDANLVAEGTGIITLSGDFVVNASSAQRSLVDFSAGASTMNLGDRLTINSAVSWDMGSAATVNFNGAIAQTIPVSAGLKFHHITTNNSSATGVNVDADVSKNKLSGDLRVQSGIFDNNGYAVDGTGTFEVANGATYVLKGSSSFSTAFASVVLGASSTVQYDGNGPQTIAEQNYGNLTSSDVGDRTLPGNKTIGIAGTFTYGGNNYTVTNSTVEYNGATAQTITAFNYYHLTSSGTGARTIPSSGTVRIAGNFTPGTNSYTITGSTIQFNGSGTGNGASDIPAFNYNNLTSSSTGDRTLASTGTIEVAGTFTPGTNTYTITGSTIEFNSTGSQTIPAFNYNNLSSANGGGRTLASSGTIGIAGTFTEGGSTHTVTGSTVDFNGSTTQSIPNFNFNNLTVSNTDVGLSGDVTVPADLVITGTLNTAGGNVTLGGDWTNNGTYTHGSKTITFNGTGTQTIGGSSSTTFFGLTVNKSSGGITLNGPITIESTLTLTAGIITSTSSNLLTFDVTAIVSGGSSSTYISGPAAKNTNSTSTFTFPLGDNSYYRPLTVVPSNTNTTTFTAEYFNSSYSNTTSLGTGLDHVSTLEYFQLDRGGTGTKADANVTLSWDSFSQVNSSYLSELRVGRWDGTEWTDMGNSSYTGDASSGSVTSNLVTQFSPFILGSSTTNNPLPVDLLSFTAEPQGMNVEITWKTASEANNDYFTIERSKNGVHFEELADINGSGNSNETILYIYDDENPLEGISYYRLKQTDFDGQFKYFPVKSVKWGDANEFKIMSIGPNPVINKLKIKYKMPESTIIKLSVVNLNGELLFEEYIFSSRGGNDYVLYKVDNLESGVYVLSLRYTDTILTYKFIK
ncbi:T9SS type A sorting domain-containing protein [Candidatus Amoebophilus asiaticus]|nr:T9SS type A sorting domain-containing protein [Candidatus Amoebophilus asiaticus]